MGVSPREFEPRRYHHGSNFFSNICTISTVETTMRTYPFQNQDTNSNSM